MKSEEVQPLVSAVIPTRGRPELVCRAVRSALAQTYLNLEVIVVIDGEDARTKTALEQIKESRVRIIALSESVGGSAARNCGVENAKGEWIAFLDDDDEWLPQKIEMQLKSLDKAPDRHSCVVVARYYYVKNDTGFEHGGQPKPGEPICEFILSRRGGYQSSVYFASRKLLKEVPFTPGLKKHQDWDWLFRVAQQPNFRLIVVNQILSKYYINHSKNRLSNQNDWAFSVMWAESMRSFLTPRAFSKFLIKTCLRSAIRAGGSWRDIGGILYKILFVGRPGISSVGQAFMILSFPDRTLNLVSDAGSVLGAAMRSGLESLTSQFRRIVVMPRETDCRS
jgi:glycosyltransferase involved in cell wall biosynthesis